MKQVIATFPFPQGTTEELARALELCKLCSSLPILITAKARIEGAELAEGTLTEETLTDGSKVCNLTLLFA